MRAHYSDVWQAISRVLPERVAIRTADEEWSYARFTREAGAFAGALAQRGVARGDRVALLLYNRPEFLTNEDSLNIAPDREVKDDDR